MSRFTAYLIWICFCSNGLFAQDVWLQNHFSPVSECGASNELVNVLVNNNSGVLMPLNTITVSYTIDGGGQVNQNVPSNLGPGASFNFNFSTQANLSACGSHVIKVWVTRAGDLNHLNDTLTWTVQNDCIIVPGTVAANTTVCQGANSGTLNLTGWSNGTITNWETSTDGGFTWNPQSNTTTAFSYLNINSAIQYRVNIDGGLCPDAVSGIATVSVQSQPIAGSISGSDSVCETNATGSLTLSGNSGSVLKWESSADNGTIWSDISNTSSGQTYNALTQTTFYRAFIDGGVCADVYSDTAIIYVDNLVPQPSLTGGDSVCVTNASGLINAPASLTDILAWESSTDNGGTWTNLANTTTSQPYSDLTQTTYYRLIADGGFCPDVISDTAVIFVQQLFPQPALGNSDTLCETAVTGVLNLSGNQSSVITWESSINNGTTWSPIANTTTSYNFNGQTVSTIYRVLLEGVFCPDYYSDTASISIDSPATMGTLFDDQDVCTGTAVELYVTGISTDSLIWQLSTDGSNWQQVPNSNNDTLVVPAVSSDVFYHVLAFSGVCPPESSNTITITALQLPIANAGSDTSIYLGESVSLFGSGGIGGIWMPGNSLSDSMIVNPVATPGYTTFYTYTVIDMNGCIGSDSVLVTVNDPAQFDIRNLVTTNNDGINDTWNITGIEFFPSTNVKVFNQYGQLVYESANYSNDWKGDWNGKTLPNGTYYYRVLKGGTQEEFKGTLTLLGND